MNETPFFWSEANLSTNTTNHSILVADSFLLENGSVRAFSRHWQRFSQQCLKYNVSPTRLTHFLTTWKSVMPPHGTWFPRWQLRQTPFYQDLQFFFRSGQPPKHSGATVWLPDYPVSRTAPAIKGPDLELSQHLQIQAQIHGATDAVFLDENGFLLEAGYSAIVWWQQDKLCLAAKKSSVIASVTVSLIEEIAQRRPIDILYQHIHRDELTEYEVWLVNAYQTIRPVDAWVTTDNKKIVAQPATQFLNYPWLEALQQYEESII